jgi:hypothetical protein
MRSPPPDTTTVRPFPLPGMNSMMLVPNRRGTIDLPDPLEAALAPPADESEDARAARVLAESRARAVSASIDAQLARERDGRKRRSEVKILLLGQSESGKSTTLKRESLPTSFPLFSLRAICAPAPLARAHARLRPALVGECPSIPRALSTAPRLHADHACTRAAATSPVLSRPALSRPRAILAPLLGSAAPRARTHMAHEITGAARGYIQARGPPREPPAPIN